MSAYECCPHRLPLGAPTACGRCGKPATMMIQTAYRSVVDYEASCAGCEADVVRELNERVSR